MADRLQKIISQCGIASRRHAEAMIAHGRIKINGRIAQLGDRADLDQDTVLIDGKPIQQRPNLIYLLLNKPAGIVSTCSDPQKRRTIIDLLPQNLRKGQGIHPVGRLDLNSSGALLLTNDGDLTLRLTHPRYHLPKTYHVWIEGDTQALTLQQWREGVMLMGKKTLPADVSVLKCHSGKTLLEVTLTEGRNRQIRRIAQQFGYKILKLHRIAIDSIHLYTPEYLRLASGQHRPLQPNEIESLRQSTYPIDPLT